MALVKDEEQKGQSVGTQTMGGSSYVGGGKGSSLPNTSVQQGAGNAQTPQFNSIMNYIDPTGNSPQSNQLGQAIAGDVSNLGAKATSDIGGWSSDATNQINAATPQFDLNTAKNQPAGFANPGYTGPTSVAGITSTYNPSASVQTATDKMGSLGKEGGIKSEMTNLYGGNGNYTSGMAGLDTAIYGSGGGGSAVNNATNMYGNLNALWTGAQNTAAGQETAGQAQGENVKGQYNQWANPNTKASSASAGPSYSYTSQPVMSGQGLNLEQAQDKNNQDKLSQRLNIRR